MKKRTQEPPHKQAGRQLALVVDSQSFEAGGSGGGSPAQPRPGDASRPEPRAPKPPTRQLELLQDGASKRHSWVACDGALDVCRWCGLQRWEGRLYAVAGGTLVVQVAPSCPGVPIDLPGEGDEPSPGGVSPNPGSGAEPRQHFAFVAASLANGACRVWDAACGFRLSGLPSRWPLAGAPPGGRCRHQVLNYGARCKRWS